MKEPKTRIIRKIVFQDIMGICLRNHADRALNTEPRAFRPGALYRKGVGKGQGVFLGISVRARIHKAAKNA